MTVKCVLLIGEKDINHMFENKVLRKIIRSITRDLKAVK
jgi:hypothetical protein